MIWRSSSEIPDCTKPPPVPTSRTGVMDSTSTWLRQVAEPIAISPVAVSTARIDHVALAGAARTARTPTTPRRRTTTGAHRIGRLSSDDSLPGGTPDCTQDAGSRGRSEIDASLPDLPPTLDLAPARPRARSTSRPLDLATLED